MASKIKLHLEKFSHVQRFKVLLSTVCLLAATAPQQEPETESSTDPPNKGLGQTSGASNPLKDTPVSGPVDKDSDMEKSTDSIAVTLS